MRSKSTVAVFFAFVVLTVGLTWPLAPHASGAIEDYLDALLNTWILAWDGHQLLSDPLHLFDANIFHPYPDTLAFSEIILPQALLALPFSLVTGNPVFGYNVALLASFVLSGFAAYLLVLDMTRSRWGGLAAGLIFAFNAYRMSNLAQVQLLVLQWLPLALLYLGRTLKPTVGKNAPRRDLVLLVLFVALQALASFYYAVLSAIAIGVYIVVALAVERRMLRPQAILSTLVALAVAVAVLVPCILPYMRVEHELGFRRSVTESEPFSASLAQYGQALSGNLLYGKLAAAAPVVIGGYPLDSLFPGVLTVVLVLPALIVWRRRLVLWVFPLALGVLSFLFSLGPTLMLAPGHPVGLPLPMPYRLLYLLPGLQALRAPVRFAALVFLSLSILAGLGVAALDRYGVRRLLSARFSAASHPGDHPPRDGHRPMAWAAILASAWLLAEVITTPPVQINPVATGSSVPDVYRWLANETPGVILELPMIGTLPERGLLNQYFSIYHWQKTPDGYSGFIPPKHGQIAYEMQFFPSERSLSLLQGLGVRYLVVHTDLIADWAQREQQLAAHAADIVPVKQFGTTHVYQVSTRQMLSSLRFSLYLPSTVQTDMPYTVSLIAVNENERSIIVSPTTLMIADITWKAADRTTMTSTQRVMSLPIVTSHTAVATAAFAAPAIGTYNVTVRVHLPDGDEISQSATVAVRDTPSPLPQIIPVQMLSGGADRESYRPGDLVHVQLRWKALGKIDAYYSVFVRILDGDGRAVAQVDGQPSDGTRPTLLWIPGEIIEDNWQLQLPASAAPGRYTVETGIYRPEDLSPRLTLDTNGQPVERLLLGSLRVAPPLDVATAPALPVGAFLGDKITLLGFDIQGCFWIESRCRVQPGQLLTVTLHWRADKETPVNYVVFLHLADSTGHPVAQHDGQPRQGSYPTSVWQRGDVITDTHILTVPESAKPSEYRLLTGMYDLATGMRLITASAGDSIPLATIVVP